LLRIVLCILVPSYLSNDYFLQVPMSLCMLSCRVTGSRRLAKIQVVVALVHIPRCYMYCRLYKPPKRGFARDFIASKRVPIVCIRSIQFYSIIKFRDFIVLREFIPRCHIRVVSFPPGNYNYTSVYRHIQIPL
jgi:hypothetical protein